MKKAIITFLFVLLTMCVLCTESYALFEQGNQRTTSDASAEVVETVEIGSGIRNPMMLMTLDSVKEYDKLRFTEYETGSLAQSLSKSDQNATYIAIRGSFVNYAKKEFDSNYLRGIAIIDGYEYRVGIYTLQSRIQPLGESMYYMYALVPNRLIKSYKSCVFKFGINEDFETDWEDYSDEKHYDYKYEIIIK